MAEARREEEELRDVRDMRNRNQATDRPERTKPDHLHSSQGPLSSIRAAIKRTRTNSQGDHSRERRRPEITIVSAEPLASSTWFPGASGVFPPPPSQPSWSGSISAAPQLPPSYDQVIKEKTQEEHVTTPTAAPRRSACTTIATQTDPVREEDTAATGPQCTAAPQLIGKKPAAKRPKKPPRPSLPKPLTKPLNSSPTNVIPALKQKQAATNTITSTNAENQSDSKSDVADQHSAPNPTHTTPSTSSPNTTHTTPSTSSPNTTHTTPSTSSPNTTHTTPSTSSPNTTHTTPSTSSPNTTHTTPSTSSPNTTHTTPSTSTPSVIVHWDVETKHNFSEPLSTTIDCTPSTPAEPPPPSSDSVLTERPTPLPRLKSRKQPIAEEVKVQTLVRLSDNEDIVPVTSSADPEDVSSNKYLQELLDVFSEEDGQREQCCDAADQSDESEQSEDAGGEMSGLHSQRSIRARIQAIESQTSVDEEADVQLAKRPEPRPRNVHNKPPIAAKPPLASRLSIKRDNVENGNQEFIAQTPAPAPRPQPPNKPVGLMPEEADTPPTKSALLPPSRPSLTRGKCFELQEEDFALGPPAPPVKPAKEPLRPNLNLNNHNSTSVVTENEYMDSPSYQTSVKPQVSVDSGEGFFSRQGIARRPTTIRVPSKSRLSESLDSPPPLPTQKPVGSLPRSLSHKPSFVPVLPTPDYFSTGPELSLPPRPTGGKILPPRPPPAKAGPGRPPPPRADSAGRSPSIHGAAWESSSPKLQSQVPAQKLTRKGPGLPPRPDPRHRLYNKYTLELPHGIASFDYNGSNTGELSFQKNEVLVLLEDIDHKTFECQVGDTRGRVQKTHMKVITPLSSVMPLPQDSSPFGSGGDSCGLQVQVIHDFNPDGLGELGLRAGDVVSAVEQVDSDWYKGTCRGYSGLFPINYVKVLSNSPKPINNKKLKPSPSSVSGPRCVARFDFEGEHSDELTFSEGDVIKLKEYTGQDWARGQVGVFTGIFPLIFVEIIEDLPPPSTPQPAQPTKIALPGMATSPNTQPKAAKPIEASLPGSEWAVALYDFTGQTEGDLSFQEGERIQVTQHLDADWCSGRLNGREGVFPKAFVETSTGQVSVLDRQQSVTAGGVTAKALFNYSSDCEDDLSLQVGDIITNLETIDEEWFLGDLRGKRALVPKNYVQVLG